MPRFQYVALDARGQESTGSMEAKSANEAIGQLRQAGYFPTGVYEDGKAPASRDGKVKRSRAARVAPRAAPAPKRKGVSITLLKRQKVKSKILMIFTRQLATLIDSGLPLLRSLNVLARQERDSVLKRTTEALADAVQSGNTFSDSLAQHPKIFNELYVSMVKAGELGGVLEVVLARLSEFQEKAQKIKGKVVAAMFYPIAVMVVAVAILGILMVFVVPKFEAIFKDMLPGKPLPSFTVLVLGISNVIKDHAIVTVCTFIALSIAFVFWKKTKSGRYVVDKLKLKMPVLGPVFSKVAISRFARTL